MRTRRPSENQLEIALSVAEEEGGLPGTAEAPERILRALGVSLGPDRGREFVYTDKGRARWAGETHRSNTSSYHGLTAGMHKLVEDWVLFLGDRRLEPSEAARVVVYPHKLVRHYARENTREEVFLCEGSGTLVVLYTTEHRGLFRFAPRFDIRPLSSAGRSSYRVEWIPELNLLRVSHAAWPEPVPSGPRAVGVTSSEALAFAEHAVYSPTVHPQDLRRGSRREVFPFQAGVLTGRVRSGRVAFIFSAADTDEEIRESLRQALFRRQEIHLERTARLARVAGPRVTDTGDPKLEHRLRWAAASLDALLMNQQGPGLYAGLPWFCNYWTRDTFISLPALLCLGQAGAARDVMRGALARQCQDPRSGFCGRLPNLVSPGEEVHYNTADGTWWFVLAAFDYVHHTGDLAFAREILPGLIRAVEGELRTRVDGEGFSVHGDAETWMDASFGGIPWSPRGSRAVEVQALWHGSLLAGAALAEWAGEGALAADWRRRAAGLRESFRRRFWDQEGRRLFDHLDPDGTPDRKIRPNQVFALTVSPLPLLPADEEAAVLDCVMKHLVYAHGVGTLPPEDPDFCPRHLDLERYPFDRAYHNGDVWVWLSGPVIRALLRHGRTETAWRMMLSLLEQLHGEGAVGTLPELRNAASPEEGQNWEGTVSQAWSLAELLRSFHQDFLGLRPRLPERRIEVEPALPQALPSVRFPAEFGDVSLEVEYRVTPEAKRYRFEVRQLHEPFTLELRVRVPGAKRLVTEVYVEAPRVVEFEVRADPSGEWRATVDGDPADVRVEETPFDIGREPGIEFRSPRPWPSAAELPRPNRLES